MAAEEQTAQTAQIAIDQAQLEARRVEHMSCYAITAHRGDPRLDSITQLAIRAVGGDIGGISLIFQSEIWIPARVGIDLTTVPRAGSFCTCAIQDGSDALFEIGDARTDSRFQQSALVLPPLEFHHYAAVPLRDNRGYMLGTLWMMRHTPGHLTAEQTILFKGMANLVVETLELRHTNDVTGMPNRGIFLDYLQAILGKESDLELTVGHIDLIGFRQINDLIGWQAGNDILRIIAQRLERWAGHVHYVAHLDGDKFGFALFGSAEIITSLLEQLRQTLTQAILLNKCDFGAQFLQARIGIVQNRQLGNLDAAELVNAAETASTTITGPTTMVREYGQDMHTRSRSTSDLQALLAGDSSHGLLLPYYQPQVDIIQGKLVGLEALARWQHPSKGLILPGLFIEVAEKIGKIYQLDNLILSRVCQDLRRWIDAGLEPIPVSFNYSRSSLLHPMVIDDLERALDTYKLPGNLLELEITETQLLENYESISHRVNQFRALGVRIAVDDFGTGYSNLDAIHNFPFDRLKVDRQFVHGVGSSERIAGLFQLIQGIAELFKADLLCEGLEHYDDLLWLQRRNVSYVQGWYFCAARPYAEIVDILTTLREHRKDTSVNGADYLRQLLQAPRLISKAQ